MSSQANPLTGAGSFAGYAGSGLGLPGAGRYTGASSYQMPWQVNPNPYVTSSAWNAAAGGKTTGQAMSTLQAGGSPWVAPTSPAGVAADPNASANAQTTGAVGPGTPYTPPPPDPATSGAAEAASPGLHTGNAEPGIPAAEHGFKNDPYAALQRRPAAPSAPGMEKFPTMTGAAPATSPMAPQASIAGAAAAAPSGGPVLGAGETLAGGSQGAMSTAGQSGAAAGKAANAGAAIPQGVIDKNASKTPDFTGGPQQAMASLAAPGQSQEPVAPGAAPPGQGANEQAIAGSGSDSSGQIRQTTKQPGPQLGAGETLAGGSQTAQTGGAYGTLQSQAAPAQTNEPAATGSPSGQPKSLLGSVGSAIGDYYGGIYGAAAGYLLGNAASGGGGTTGKGAPNPGGIAAQNNIGSGKTAGNWVNPTTGQPNAVEPLAMIAKDPTLVTHKNFWTVAMGIDPKNAGTWGTLPDPTTAKLQQPLNLSASTDMTTLNKLGGSVSKLAGQYLSDKANYDQMSKDLTTVPADAQGSLRAAMNFLNGKLQVENATLGLYNVQTGYGAQPGNNVDSSGTPNGPVNPADQGGSQMGHTPTGNPNDAGSAPPSGNGAGTPGGGIGGTNPAVDPTTGQPYPPGQAPPGDATTINPGTGPAGDVTNTSGATAEAQYKTMWAEASKLAGPNATPTQIAAIVDQLAGVTAVDNARGDKQTSVNMLGNQITANQNDPNRVATQNLTSKILANPDPTPWQTVKNQYVENADKGLGTAMSGMSDSFNRRGLGGAAGANLAANAFAQNNRDISSGLGQLDIQQAQTTLQDEYAAMQAADQQYQLFNGGDTTAVTNLANMNMGAPQPYQPTMNNVLNQQLGLAAQNTSDKTASNAQTTQQISTGLQAASTIAAIAMLL